MPHCKSIEKTLYRRLIDRLEVAGNSGSTEEQRREAIYKREELQDILTEWRNIRIDLTKDEEA